MPIGSHRGCTRVGGVLTALLVVAVASACVPPPPPTGGSGGFQTLPPGSTLPTDQQCGARVRRAPENRAVNVRYNQTVGHPAPPSPPYFVLAGRVTGNFTGTTDEIIQWAACKWGINENIARAQVAKESWWHQDNKGDWTSNPANCPPGHPIGADGRPGQCPESMGLMQVRTPYFQAYISDAIASSAYNLDIAYASWRACYEGHESWLNTVERGRQYAAGDVWGCIGRWFSGRWYTQPANEYIASVQDYLNHRVWTTPEFANG
jgi:autotransporter family porin